MKELLLNEIKPYRITVKRKFMKTYEEYIEDIRFELNDLFSNISIEEFRKLCQELYNYNEYKKSRADVIDFTLISESDYNDIVREVITDYIDENEITPSIQELADDDVTNTSEGCFTFKGQEYKGYDDEAGGNLSCNYCPNFELIYEAVVDSDCAEKEELTMYLCGMNFMFYTIANEEWHKFYFS